MRRRTEPLLAAIDAARLLTDVGSQTSVGVGVMDRERRYVFVNELLAEMNGVPAAKHAGRTLEEVLGEAARFVRPFVDRALGGEALLDLALQLPDGRSFNGSYFPLHEPSGAVCGLATLVVERTGLEQTEAALLLARQRLALALEGTGTGTFEYDAEGDELHWSENLGPLFGVAAGTSPAGFEDSLELIHPDDRDAVVRAAATALKSGLDYEVEFRVAQLPGSPWRAAQVHVLKSGQGRPLRLIGLMRDIDARKRREIANDVLARAGAALAGALDVASTLRQVAELAVPELADWARIQLLDGDGRLQQVAVAHVDPDKVELAERLAERYPPDPEARVGAPAVARTGRSELYAEITPELLELAAVDAEHLQLVRDLELRSALSVPIAAGNRTLGVLSFVHDASSDRRYGAEELALAEELGRRAGLAIDNARLHEQARAANRRLRRLQEVTDVALTHSDLDDLLEQLLVRVRRALDVDVAVVLLHAEDLAVLRPHAALGLDFDPRTEIPFGRGISGRIAKERRPLAVADVREHELLDPLRSGSVSSVAGVPLVLGPRTIGVLLVATRETREFGQDDVRLLELVGDRAARAIDHARLYEQARETALTLQHSLLPLSLPELPGYELAARYLPGEAGAQVGGDWYDVFPLRDGRFGLVVGDVVGRGIPAAAGMGQLRSAMQALLWEASDPARAMQVLDGVVGALGQVTFATALAFALDPASGALQGCIAGHPPPVVRRPDGTCAVLGDLPGGPPLSALPGTARATANTRLAPGETMLLYTDGLVERRDISLDERFRALEAALCAGPEDLSELLDHLVAEMLVSGRTDDDAALVLVRRRGSAPDG